MKISDLPLHYNCVDILEHNLAKRADKTALYSVEREMTFREVVEEVNQAGNALQKWGVRIGDPVAILSLDLPEWVTSFFGVLKIGGVAVGLSMTGLSPSPVCFSPSVLASICSLLGTSARVQCCARSHLERPPTFWKQFIGSNRRSCSMCLPVTRACWQSTTSSGTTCRLCVCALPPAKRCRRPSGIPGRKRRVWRSLNRGVRRTRSPSYCPMIPPA